MSLIVGEEKCNDIKTIITDIQYFGTVNWYKMLFQFLNIRIEQYEAYQKMSFRNRTVIAGSNGLINLSVPLEKGRSQKKLIRDIKISYSENWQEQHWRSIKSCYGNSPFFEYYENSLILQFQQKQVFLLDLNLRLLDWVKKQLKLNGQVEMTEAYQTELDPEIFDGRNLFTAKTLREDSEPIRYTQVFEDRIGFKPNLSILDLLFCAGPAANSMLK